MGRRGYIVSHHPVRVACHLPNEVQGRHIDYPRNLSQYLHRSSWDRHWGRESFFASSKRLLASYLTSPDNLSVSNTVALSSMHLNTIA